MWWTSIRPAWSNQGTTGKRDPRFERRKARTAEALLGAAVRLFVEHGYVATTVEQLASEADVAVGSLYGHFGGKDGLYLAVVNRALELDKRYMDEAYDPELPPDQQLLAVSDAYLRFYREQPGFFRVFVFPPRDSPSADIAAGVAKQIVSRIEAETGRLAATIGRVIAAGVARPVEPRLAAIFLHSAWNGVISAHLRPDRLSISDDELAAVLRQGRELVLNGLLIGPGPD